MMSGLAVLIVALGFLRSWNYRRVDRLKARGEFVPMSTAARVVLIFVAIIIFGTGVTLLRG